jgi:hypothetical protein
MATDNQERSDLARYLLQHSAYDDAHEPLSAEAQATEYKRLLAALARLQLLKNHVEVWIGSSLFTVTIRDEQYITCAMCSADGLTMVDACEGALAEYDKAVGK